MAITPLALGIQQPNINPAGAYAEGVSFRQQVDANKLAAMRAGVELLASAGLSALNGDLNGEVNPEAWNTALDDLEGMNIPGLNLENYRDPEMARSVAFRGLSAAQAVSLAQTQSELDLVQRQFEAELEADQLEIQAANDLAERQWNWAVNNLPQASLEKIDAGVSTVEAEAALIGGLPDEDVLSREGDLRGEYEGLPDVKKFREQTAAYQRVLDSAQRQTGTPSPAGDMALIFSFMRLLDPASTVREGEYATAASAASIPERIRAQYNAAVDGETLTTAMRQDFVTRAGELYRGAAGQMEMRNEQFSRLAEDAGVDANNIIFSTPQIGILDPNAAPTSTPTPLIPETPQVGDTVIWEDGTEYRFIGGDPSQPSSWEPVR